MYHKKSIIPYLRGEEIEYEAECFREKFWDNTVPIDIEKIIDIKLQIDIIPIPGFFRLTSTDALITSDWKSMYVDKEEYEDEHRHNRLRFSYAHEIGHLVLHKTIYTRFNIKELKDYCKLFEDITQQEYNYLEYQANNFASHLLIPRKILKIESMKMIKKAEEDLQKIIEKNLKILKERGKKVRSVDRIDRATLNSYIAIPLSNIFKVSEEAITIALNDLYKY